jgi:carbonic anhydrase/acetyltransferase-like protein (isoleucine patch superfamily)
VGIGSIVLNGAKIGAGSLVGANTLITEGKEFPPRSMILGSPGKVVRQLTEEESERLKASAGRYVANWKRYVEGLVEQD